MGTDLRAIIPGAFTSTRVRCLLLIGPLPQQDFLKHLQHVLTARLLLGTSIICDVRLTISPCLIARSLPKTTHQRFHAQDLRPYQINPLKILLILQLEHFLNRKHEHTITNR